MKQQENIKALFEKYLNNACTAQEIRVLFAYFEGSDKEEELRQLIRSEVADDHYSQPHARDKLDALTGRVETRLIDAIRPKRRPLAVRLLSRPALAPAAMLFAVLSIGALLYQQWAGTEAVVAAQEDVLPGGNLATLTLADGRVIQLSTEQHGIVIGDGVTYLDGSSVNGGKPGAENSSLDDMVLTTPKGGTYQLTLSDGSKVWLNAASTLRYPARFGGRERVVELEGEAYFDVSHRQPADGDNQHVPFRVVSRGQTVEVLGTQFNIAAYPDEEAVRTTLVEGAVQLISGSPEQSAGRTPPIILRPGEQSLVKDGQAVVNPVDVRMFTAWKNGLFSFRETEMRQAMKQLARWYNVDIAYEGKIPETYFFGDIKRDKNLSHVLAVLKKSGINFRIEKQGDRHRISVLP